MSVFELLRDQLSIREVVERYSEIKGDTARCVAPEHEDNNPSMHLYGDHVHCFSCGFHGDVVDVCGAARDIARPIEAALDLAREFGVAARVTTHYLAATRASIHQTLYLDISGAESTLRVD